MKEKRNMLSNFCRHVYNPGEYLIVFIILVVFFVGAGVFSAVTVLKPMDEINTEQHTVTFSNWRIEEDTVILTSPQTQETYEIRGYPDYLSDFATMQKKCDGITNFTVWAMRREPDDNDPYYSIYAISSGEEVYLTFENSNIYRRQDLSFVFNIFGSLLLFVLLISAFIFIVGCYPQKFPKWIVYSCFKKSAIDI